jgi:diguanylate cyclase (GGDEF)-like protein
MTNADFLLWLDIVGANTGDPNGLGYAYLARVPASGLNAFETQLLADPPPDALPSRRFQLVPPGARAEYCLLRLGTSDFSARRPLGLDLCSRPGTSGPSSAPVAADLAEAGDTSLFTVFQSTPGVFDIAAPLYRGGEDPGSLSGRRAALLGWATATFDGATLLLNAGALQPGLHIQLTHQNPGERLLAIAQMGTADGGGYAEVPVSQDGSWMMRVSGSLNTQGLSAGSQFWIVLGVGIALSGLLFGFVLVLARSRSRAWRLVERKTDELQYQALHDSLTGLPNRALILDRVEGALSRCRRQNTPVAVMFLDLDEFKRVNDTFGHAAGDQLLRAVSTRLIGVLRASDTVGRLGGDEFVVVVEGDSLDAGPEVIAERIRQTLAEPFLLGATGDLTLTVRVSIGIAVGLRANAGDLLRDADVALYRAKGAGKDSCVVFSEEMQASAQDWMAMEMDLRAAVGTDQFFLMYQPIFDLSTSKITGVEALLRWEHPTRGLIMPDEFIPVAEDARLMVPIGRWVLAQSCRQAAQWQRDGHPLGVSINISAHQLGTGTAFLDDVRTTLRETGLDPASLTLEIAEPVLMHDATASGRQLQALKTLGVRIAIDDFGTGYSSLSYLQKLPVDALKIDRSFISGFASIPDSSALIHILVQLGKTLGIETLAEGIEESGQLQHLRREQCDSGQGYLFARPLSPAALEELIAAIPLAPGEPSHVP